MRRIQTSIVFTAMLLLANASAGDEKKPTLKETLNWIQDRVNSSQFQQEWEQRFSFVINEDPSFAIEQKPPNLDWRHRTETIVPLKKIDGVVTRNVTDKKALLNTEVVIFAKHPTEPFTEFYYPANGGGKKHMKWGECAILAPNKEIAERIRTAVLYAVERAKTDPPPKEIF